MTQSFHIDSTIDQQLCLLPQCVGGATKAKNKIGETPNCTGKWCTMATTKPGNHEYNTSVFSTEVKKSGKEEEGKKLVNLVIEVNKRKDDKGTLDDESIHP